MYVWLIAAVWTLTILGFLFWDIVHLRSVTKELAMEEARASFRKDQAFRYWGASHGGVYVPVDENTPPSPYLKDIPERDITTPSGKKLTLMNPAYMVRQMSEYFNDLYGIAGHITSLKLLRPDNKPDEWERKALEAFERGEKEVLEFTDIGGKPFLRLMQPMITKEGCLKCHAERGYKAGDVRGGVSVSVPMEGFLARERSQIIEQVASHGFIWILGLAGLRFGSRRLRRSILERERAENITARFGRILDNSSNEIYIFNADSLRFIQVNLGARQNLGYAMEELENLTPLDLKPEHTRESFSELLKPLRTGERDHIVFTAVHLRKDGTSYPVEVRLQLSVTETPHVFVAIVQNTTERKRAEEENARLATAIAQSAETIVITDTEGTIQYVNPAFEKITGYTREDALGQNPRVLKSGRHDETFYKNLWNTITKGEVWFGHFINRKKDGTFYEEEATISPVFGSDGKIVNFVAVKRDVTYESMLQRARDYFTAVTSHELRAPLIKLQLAKIMAEECGKEVDKPEKLDKLLSILGESYEGLNRILSATDMLSDLNAPQAEKHLHPVFLYPNLITCIESAHSFIKKINRNVRLYSEIDDFPKDIQIPGNQEMVMKAIDGILSNAVKYTPDGKGIKVAGKLENGNAVIEISDEGIGIPKGKMELVFEPYFSLEDALKHSTGEYAFKGGGLGLGLALARMIMEYHGGKLEVCSEGENKGTTVTMTFPAVKQSAS